MEDFVDFLQNWHVEDTHIKHFSKVSSCQAL